MEGDADLEQTLPDPRAASSDPRPLGDPDEPLVPVDPQERYEMRASLGEGGMGEVRLARDRLVGREVAMKLVRAEHAGRADSRARFVREARVQAQLEHPAIVPVYDFGIDAQGDTFFTMRRVRGLTLADILDALQRGDPEAEREHSRHKLLGAFVRVCLAVSFAHERGVLHRDLKPANVMLGGFGEVYVLDWGLAKVSAARRALDPAPGSATVSGVIETGAGSLVGTPAYMAPEQVRGEESDARADVYALGAILFELLTLEPLHGIGPVAAVLSRITRGVDARASIRVPERGVPPELEAICVRATARDPDDRFSSARELADAVDAYLAGDRDMELRKELARAHLDLARAASERARERRDAGPDRAVALAEVGRALALAPADREAIALLVALLTEPPREPPVEVRQAVESINRASQTRMLLPAAAMYFFGWLVFVPVQAALGVRDWALALMPLAGFAGTSALCLLAYRLRDQLRVRVLQMAGLASCAAIALMSVIYGALLVLPAAMAVNTMGTVLVTPRSRRRSVFTANLVALLVPLALTAADVHPVRHVFDGERSLGIMNDVIAMPKIGTLVTLAISYVVILGLAATFAARYRDALINTQLANELQAWQLRQLVPREATEKPLKA